MVARIFIGSLLIWALKLELSEKERREETNIQVIQIAHLTLGSWKWFEIVESRLVGWLKRDETYKEREGEIGHSALFVRRLERDATSVWCWSTTGASCNFKF